MNNQNIPVSLSIAPDIDVSSIKISAQDAAQTVSGDVKIPEKLNIINRESKPVYAVSGYAEDSVLNFKFNNPRTAVVDAESGKIISIYKENVLVSFFKTVIDQTARTWEFK